MCLFDCPLDFGWIHLGHRKSTLTPSRSVRSLQRKVGCPGDLANLRARPTSIQSQRLPQISKFCPCQVGGESAQATTTRSTKWGSGSTGGQGAQNMRQKSDVLFSLLFFCCKWILTGQPQRGPVSLKSPERARVPAKKDRMMGSGRAGAESNKPGWAFS